MGGFLDKNTRVVDMVLTSEGKRLLSRGELDFAYFALFDDEVDYQSYVSTSGSLLNSELSASWDTGLESTLIREAVTGYRYPGNVSGSDNVNVSSVLFTMPQGQRFLPRATFSPDTGSIDMHVVQRQILDIPMRKEGDGRTIQQSEPIDRGVERSFDPSTLVNVALDLGPDGSFPERRDGFRVVLLRSGTEGLVEVDPKIDSLFRLSYLNDLILTVK